MGRKLDGKKMLDDSTKFLQSKNYIAPKFSSSLGKNFGCQQRWRVSRVSIVSTIDQLEKWSPSTSNG